VSANKYLGGSVEAKYEGLDKVLLPSKARVANQTGSVKPKRVGVLQTSQRAKKRIGQVWSQRL